MRFDLHIASAFTSAPWDGECPDNQRWAHGLSLALVGKERGRINMNRGDSLRPKVVAGVLIGARPHEAEAANASTPIAYQQSCSTQSDRVNVVFLWVPSDQGSQWLDLSLADNGFAPRTFVGVGPLSPVQDAFSWEGLLPGATHFVRVNTITPQGWVSGPAYAFTTRSCHAPASRPVLFEQHCGTTPGTVSVTLRWTPADEGQEWVDLSVFNNGFAPGTYIGDGPLADGTDALVWSGLLERTSHTVRVNSVTAVGWHPGPPLQFTTMSCTTIARKIVLSFDDGGDPASGILDVLDRYGVKAIFFPTGIWSNAHPDIIKRMINAGHLVGDHTYTHRVLTRLSADQIRAEITGGNVGNTDLYRPPYEAINPLVSSIVSDMGFRMFLWNIDPRDWARTYAGGDQEIVDQIMSRAFPGAVVILHLQVRNTLIALPTIIERLRAAGYAVGL